MGDPRVRHLPHQSVLYRVVSEHLGELLDDARSLGGFPPFIERTFRAYLDCGMPEKGFIRVHCGACGHDSIVAFSCKKRGVCPSCAGRFMGDGAANLVDHVLPRAPYRQWVVSYPFELNGVLAFQPDTISAVERLVMRAISEWMKRRCGGGMPGGVLVRHRFGSTVNLHIHAHLLVLDGVYRKNGVGMPVFEPARAPTIDEIGELAGRLRVRLHRLLLKRGALPRPEDESNLELPLDALGACANAAMRRSARQRTGPALSVVDEDEVERPNGALVANAEGLSLYASAPVPADDRVLLEKSRYLLRGPITLGRLQQRPDGMLSYRLRKPDRRGNTVALFSPRELLMRLASLIPAPHHPTRRLFGVLAAGSKLRRLVVPAPTTAKRKRCTDDEARPPRPVQHALKWAELLKRVWSIDALKCTRCGGRMVALAVIEEPEQIARYLGHTGELSIHERARAPPGDDHAAHHAVA